jgi:hypothetical protein
MRVDGSCAAGPGERRDDRPPRFPPYRETTMLLRYETGDLVSALAEDPSRALAPTPAEARCSESANWGSSTSPGLFSFSNQPVATLHSPYGLFMPSSSQPAGLHTSSWRSSRLLARAARPAAIGGVLHLRTRARAAARARTPAHAALALAAGAVPIVASGAQRRRRRPGWLALGALTIRHADRGRGGRGSRSDAERQLSRCRRPSPSVPRRREIRCPREPAGRPRRRRPGRCGCRS